jgi:hypothetical protein
MCMHLTSLPVTGSGVNMSKVMVSGPVMVCTSRMIAGLPVMAQFVL